MERVIRSHSQVEQQPEEIHCADRPEKEGIGPSPFVQPELHDLGLFSDPVSTLISLCNRVPAPSRSFSLLENEIMPLFRRGLLLWMLGAPRDWVTVTMERKFLEIYLEERKRLLAEMEFRNLLFNLLEIDTFQGGLHKVVGRPPIIKIKEILSYSPLLKEKFLRNFPNLNVQDNRMGANVLGENLEAPARFYFENRREALAAMAKSPTGRAILRKFSLLSEFPPPEPSNADRNKRKDKRRKRRRH